MGNKNHNLICQIITNLWNNNNRIGLSLRKQACFITLPGGPLPSRDHVPSDSAEWKPASDKAVFIHFGAPSNLLLSTGFRTFFLPLLDKQWR